jgi:hypothetical protein
MTYDGSLSGYLGMRLTEGSINNSMFGVRDNGRTALKIQYE